MTDKQIKWIETKHYTLSFMRKHYRFYHLLLSFCILCPMVSFGQAEPRPEWVRNTPFPPKEANYIFYYGVGTGEKEETALVAAWKDALYKALIDGVLLGNEAQQNMFDQARTLQDLDSVIPTDVLKRRLVCQTLPIFLQTDEVKVYVLIQVQKDRSKPTDFYDYEIPFECDSKAFKKDIDEWNFVEYHKKLREQKRIANLGPPYLIKNYNNFFAWGVISTGYPFNLSTSVMHRYGRDMGLGYQLSLGVESLDGYSQFHYTLGLKFYPYKNLFLSANYGTLGIEEVIVKSQEGAMEKIVKQQNKGVFLLLGYDFVMGNPLNRRQTILSIGSGPSYDVDTKNWKFYLDLKIGLSWKLD